VTLLEGSLGLHEFILRAPKAITEKTKTGLGLPGSKRRMGTEFRTKAPPTVDPAGVREVCLLETIYLSLPLVSQVKGCIELLAPLTHRHLTHIKAEVDTIRMRDLEPSLR